MKKKFLNCYKTQNQGAQKEPQSMAWKYFKVATTKLYYDNLSICVYSFVMQSKINQVKTIYKLIKLISYISPTFSD